MTGSEHDINGGITSLAVSNTARPPEKPEISKSFNYAISISLKL